LITFLTFLEITNHKTLEFIEIGNKPDLKHFWPASIRFPVFFNENILTLKKIPAIKNRMSRIYHLSAIFPPSRLKAQYFLHKLKVEGVKLDFISPHIYSNHPADFYEAVSVFRKMSAEENFIDIHLHVTELNCDQRQENIDPELIT